MLARKNWLLHSLVLWSGSALAERSYCLLQTMGSDGTYFYYVAQVASDVTQADSCGSVVIRCDNQVTQPWPNEHASCTGGNSCVPFTESSYVCTTIDSIP